MRSRNPVDHPSALDLILGLHDAEQRQPVSPGPGFAHRAALPSDGTGEETADRPRWVHPIAFTRVIRSTVAIGSTDRWTG